MPMPVSSASQMARKHSCSDKGQPPPNTKRPKTDGVGGTRQNFDKNTLRIEYSKVFDKVILDHKPQHKPLNRGKPTSIKVYARCRPMFEKETNRGEINVFSKLDKDEVAIHSCLFKADLKTPFITHYRFLFDDVFGQDCSNDQVYSDTLKGMVGHACTNGTGCMFMFGQTGSGKTYTMDSLTQQAADDIYRTNPKKVSLSFVELVGDSVHDLLNGRKKLALREKKDGSYMMEDLHAKDILTSKDLCADIAACHKMRKTSATEANQTSSRSHAVSIINIGEHGRLMLLDCAGTERNKDSMHHDAEQRREGAEINASLFALKECIRSYNQNKDGQKVVIPFRQSSLTKVLAEAFHKNAQLSVICTASPCCTDTEHSITTLRTGFNLSGRADSATDELDQAEFATLLHVEAKTVSHPKSWTPEQVQNWLVNVDKKKFEKFSGNVPKATDGAMLVKFTQQRMKQICNSEELGRRLYKFLHLRMEKADASKGEQDLLSQMHAKFQAKQNS